MAHFQQRYPIVPYDPLMIPNPTQWLVNGIWQLHKINGIAGFEKSGKSRLVNWILVGMATGVVFNNVAMPQKVLYLCGEEPVTTVNDRIRRYAELQGIPELQFSIGFVEAAGMRLDIKNQRTALLEMILDNDYEMLVIDPWRRVHGADEDKSTVMSPIYNDLRMWSNKYNLTMVIVHHTPKIGIDTDMDRIASWFRGSTDLAAILDTAQYVDRTNKRTIELRRQGRFAPLPILKLLDTGDMEGFTLA